jgi:hypothetical protein
VKLKRADYTRHSPPTTITGTNGNLKESRQRNKQINNNKTALIITISIPPTPRNARQH